MSPHHLCACLFSRPCLSSSLLCWEKELRQSQGEGVREPPSKHFSEDYVFRLPPYIPPFTLHVYACLSNDSAWGQCLKPAPFSSLYVIHFDVGLQRQERLRGEGKKKSEGVKKIVINKNKMLDESFYCGGFLYRICCSVVYCPFWFSYWTSVDCWACLVCPKCSSQYCVWLTPDPQSCKKVH